MRFERIYLSKTARRIIRNEILYTKNQFETGGILMGYCSRGKELVITHASSPGPKAIQKRRSITFDTEFCQKCVNQIFEESSGYFTYLGDWHSHTIRSLKPSFTDRLELKRMDKGRNSIDLSPIILIAFATSYEFVSRTFSMYERLYLIPETTLLDYDIECTMEEG